MSKKWLLVPALLLVAYAIAVLSPWNAFLQPPGSTVAAEPGYPHYWAELYGTEAMVTYCLEYECGHQLLLPEEELTYELLGVSPAEMAQTVSAMLAVVQPNNGLLVQAPQKGLCPHCRSTYWIGNDNGAVAVWQGKEWGSASFLRRYDDMSVERLPPEVQARLQQGIPVYSEADLQQAIEGLDR